MSLGFYDWILVLGDTIDVAVGRDGEEGREGEREGEKVIVVPSLFLTRSAYIEGNIPITFPMSTHIGIMHIIFEYFNWSTPRSLE